MGQVKDLMADVEEFVYDFYDDNGNMLESPRYIIDLAIKKFGWSFGSYAGEVFAGADEDMGACWEYNKVTNYSLNDELPF